jgi:hypothetical protein
MSHVLVRGSFMYADQIRVIFEMDVNVEWNMV